MSEHDQFSKRPEPDDPLSMHAESAPGDPLLMLNAIIEEFACIGYDAARIRSLFDEPHFQATYGLRKFVDSATLHERIDAVLERCGVMRVTITRPTESENGTFVSAERLRKRGER